MRLFEISNLTDYIDFVAGLGDQEVFFRGAKDAIEGMLPTVVRSWQANARIRADEGEDQHLDLWGYECALIEAFQRHSLPYLEKAPHCHLNWLAVAQHHQLPTRLLDWTRNPLIALYFAVVERGPYQPPVSWPDVHVYVWEVGDARDARRAMIPLDRQARMANLGDGLIADPETGRDGGVLLFTPPTISSRIASQEGLFSFEARLSQTPFPDLAERHGLRLSGLRIRGGARFSILRHLSRLGVESGKLFPDLSGLCAHQRWAAEWLW